MKILKNNYDVKRIACDRCESELEYNGEDMCVTYREVFVRCPLCSHKIMITKINSYISKESV